MAGTAQHEPAVGSVPPGEERDADHATLDAELRMLAATFAAAALTVGGAPRDAIRAGLTALLDTLARDAERTWDWLAAWPDADPARARHRLAVDDALCGALQAVGIAPDVACSVVRDGWSLVHEHLWVERHPDLRGLISPLMALVALRTAGPGAVRDELAGHAA